MPALLAVVSHGCMSNAVCMIMVISVSVSLESDKHFWAAEMFWQLSCTFDAVF